jgi:hypothetical protein
MVPALRSAVDAAMMQVERAKLGGAVDYAGYEREIHEKLCEVERRAHEVALSALDPNVPKLLINKVPHARVLEDEPKTFMSQPGPVRVARSLYRPLGERNAPTVDVVALRAGAIEDVWLPATAREMAFDVQQLTSARRKPTESAGVGCPTATAELRARSPCRRRNARAAARGDRAGAHRAL